MLQLVTAVIQPHKLEPVRDALKEAGVGGITITEVRGFGQQAGHTETYRGAEYQVDFIPKIKIEILCGEDETARITDLILEAARTDRVGAGKIWIAPVASVVRIRTGESGPDAL